MQRGLPSKGLPDHAPRDTILWNPILSPSIRASKSPNLFRIAAHPDEIPWEPFRDGVEIHRLYGDGITGPNAALIRFRKDGMVPAHEHTGYEHIIVLAGTQRDQNSTAAAGALIINPPGTTHSVVSEAGCIVLAIYERPVRFLAHGDHGTVCA